MQVFDTAKWAIGGNCPLLGLRDREDASNILIWLQGLKGEGSGMRSGSFCGSSVAPGRYPMYSSYNFNDSAEEVCRLHVCNFLGLSDFLKRCGVEMIKGGTSVCCRNLG